MINEYTRDQSINDRVVRRHVIHEHNSQYMVMKYDTNLGALTFRHFGYLISI